MRGIVYILLANGWIMTDEILIALGSRDLAASCLKQTSYPHKHDFFKYSLLVCTTLVVV